MYPAPQVFRYTGRQSFGEVYTLCFKGGDKWRCPGAVAPRWERIVLHARWPAHGRPHSYRFHPTDNRGGLTGSAWKSGDINQPNVDRWTSEETITRWVTIPEGLIVLEQFKSEKVFWRQFPISKEIIDRNDASVLPSLVDWLSHEDRHIRGNVAFVFGGFGDPRGFQVITDILSDRSDRPHPGVGGGNRTLEAQIGQDRYYAVHLWVNSAIHGRSRFLSHC